LSLLTLLLNHLYHIL